MISSKATAKNQESPGGDTDISEQEEQKRIQSGIHDGDGKDDEDVESMYPLGYNLTVTQIKTLSIEQQLILVQV